MGEDNTGEQRGARPDQHVTRESLTETAEGEGHVGGVLEGRPEGGCEPLPSDKSILGLFPCELKKHADIANSKRSSYGDPSGHGKSPGASCPRGFLHSYLAPGLAQYTHPWQMGNPLSPGWWAHGLGSEWGDPKKPKRPGNQGSAATRRCREPRWPGSPHSTGSPRRRARLGVCSTR